MTLESLTLSAPDTAAPHADAALVRTVFLARNGDADAFASLHRRFARSVHAILLARLSPADADDAVQETFVLAWKRLDSLREPGAVGPWLHAIARHVATDRHRTKARLKEEPLFEKTARVDPADRDGLRERVMAHIGTLPETYRETLTMRLVEGMTGPEISEATGLTAGSVRVNLCRGMDLLRELLKKEGWP